MSFKTTSLLMLGRMLHRNSASTVGRKSPYSPLAFGVLARLCRRGIQAIRNCIWQNELAGSTRAILL
jgi:hypothetical protein